MASAGSNQRAGVAPLEVTAEVGEKRMNSLFGVGIHQKAP
jgi:hypothetical protein